ncbi:MULTISPECIES: hypothetical protein [Acidiphilium]|uniref:Uncharacterized protein n=1 Tax=Acidiphilium rubrum TaxID=526 RepID=A0A8G2FFT0_ACIRU|nr:MULTISPECIES: hypothetical protein [Acidiphilium]SIR55056.1 hypothetical protein SAMN05421828_1524 [Acidiphilium rubrum]
MTNPVKPATAHDAVSDPRLTTMYSCASHHKANLDTLELALNMLGIAVDMMLAQSEAVGDQSADVPTARTTRDNIAAIRHVCGLVENRGNVVVRSGRELIRIFEANASA